MGICIWCISIIPFHPNLKVFYVSLDDIFYTTNSALHGYLALVLCQNQVMAIKRIFLCQFKASRKITVLSFHLIVLCSTFNVGKYSFEFHPFLCRSFHHNYSLTVCQLHNVFSIKHGCQGFEILLLQNRLIQQIIQKDLLQEKNLYCVQVMQVMYEHLNAF